MMQYFKNTDANDMTQGDLSKRVRYLKCEKGGYKTMCDVAERIYTQGVTSEAKDTAQRMYKKGYEISVIADLLNRTENQIRVWLGLNLA